MVPVCNTLRATVRRTPVLKTTLGRPLWLDHIWGPIFRDATLGTFLIPPFGETRWGRPMVYSLLITPIICHSHGGPQFWNNPGEHFIGGRI
jgi:hypothetical protein